MALSKARKAQEVETEPLTAEEQAFRRQYPTLLRKYEGQFVALSQGRLVGHGRDDEELAQRMFVKLGAASFYIARVESELSVYELPSPETVH